MSPFDLEERRHAHRLAVGIHPVDHLSEQHLAFGVVGGLSFLQHHRTSQTLGLLEDGYLPLALTLSQAKATQSVYANLVERALASERSTPTKSWLRAALRIRPTTLRRAYEGVESAEQIAAAKPTADLDEKWGGGFMQAAGVSYTCDYSGEAVTLSDVVVETGDGATVTVVERAPALRPGGQAVDIDHNAVDPTAVASVVGQRGRLARQ